MALQIEPDHAAEPTEAPGPPETPQPLDADWFGAGIEPFITSEELQSRIGELAYEIADDYRNLGVTPERPLHLVGVLKGVVPFIADLMRAMPNDLPVSVDFLAITPYGPETRRNGGVRVIKDLDQSIQDRHVLVVEDIVDTGLTLGYLMKVLRQRQPTSLRVCTLLDRASVRLIDIRMAYIGFDIPDQFVVGYGLDHRERYRNLPFIGVMKNRS
jgi:hypoxanthine phosphoribosyltransferase